jgi:large subunit ribosomal protein L21
MATNKATKTKTDSDAFAVIETGGKQYVVSAGTTLRIEKLPKAGKDGAITFDKVLLENNGEKTVIGTPYIAGKKIEAEFVKEDREKKVVVLKYKSKVRYRVKTGHRQPFTEVKINKI